MNTVNFGQSLLTPSIMVQTHPIGSTTLLVSSNTIFEVAVFGKELGEPMGFSSLSFEALCWI